AVVPALVFTPTENRVTPGSSETAAFAITVKDGIAETDVRITVVSTSVNDAPVAFLARASGVQDADHPVAITLIGTDVDGTVGSFRVTSLPTTGMLYRDGAATTPVVAGAAISANGNKLTLYYKPAAGWVGDASFTYTARDDLGLDSASQAVVNLTVQPFVAEPAPVPVEAAPVPVATVPAVIVVLPASPMPASAAAAVPAPVGARPTDMDGVPGAPVELGMVVTADFGQATTVTSTDIAPARNGLRIIAPGMIAPQDANATEIASIPVATSMANFWRGLSDVLGSSGGATAAPASLTMVSGLDEFRDSIRTSEVREQQAVGISVAAGTSVSAGYVIWLLRGGVLATSLMSSLPAWRFVDPLPVLNRLGRDDDDEHDDDSLEAMVGTDPDEPEAEEDIRTPR
ncbi:MAG: hypothetical protein JWM42_4010, partial [Burkholderia sp.]|nr:hypothetical protein [Burkholderia sp.]